MRSALPACTGVLGLCAREVCRKVLLAFAPPRSARRPWRTHELEARTRHTIVHRDRLLAEFGRIREEGYALDEEEFSEGVSCVSSAVAGNGMPYAALTISAPVERFALRRKEFTEAVAAAAEALGRRPAGARQRTGGGECRWRCLTGRSQS